jgi:O-antigen ligase
MTDRFVRAALITMYVLIPLYGTFAIFAPHPPTAVLLPRPIVLAIVIALVLAAIGVIGGALRRRAPQAMRTVLIVNLIAVYTGALLGFDPIVGVFLIATGCAALVATGIATPGYYRDAGVARAIYLAILISGAFSAVVAIALAAVKAPADLYAFNHGRAVGTFLNPNELAAYLLVYLGVSCGVAIVRRGSCIGTLAAVCSAIAVIALTLTFSRMAVVAAFCGLLFYMLVMRPRRGIIAAISVFVIAAGVNVALSARHHDPQDTEIRSVAWQAGVTTFVHFPLTGVGPLAFERLYPVLRAPQAPGADTPIAYDPHDMPLSIAAETGALGLAAFVWMLWTFGREFRRAFARVSGERRTFGVAILAGLVALVVHSLINSVSIFFALILQFPALALAATYWGFDPDAA